MAHKEKYTQYEVECMFNYMFNGCPLDFPEDCAKIQLVLKIQRHINISASEAAKFWEYRSNLWDASWLVLDNDETIMKYWDQFINEWYKDYDDI